MANPNKMGGNTSPPFGTIPTGAGLTTDADADAAARGPTEDATMLSKGLVKKFIIALRSFFMGSSASRGRPLSQLDACHQMSSYAFNAHCMSIRLGMLF